MSFKDALKKYREATEAELIEVKIDEFEQTFFVRPMITAREMCRIEAATEKGNENVAIELMLLLARDAAGKRIYSDAERPDVEVIPHAILSKVASKLQSIIRYELPDESEKK